MKNITLLMALCLVVFLSGCAPKMIHPTDSRGLKCVDLITKVKNLCYETKKDDIEACRDRNREREEFRERDKKLMEEKAKDSKAHKDKKLLAYALVSLRGSLEMENCNKKFAKECNDEYKENFVSKCGGRIE
ncbi:MAG: hypothetical protein D3904_01240 [Candidatus Electrothrix sp. EH2]|nr:hypothetical protein [Candidatus Electrothrix sp. EH2]